MLTSHNRTCIHLPSADNGDWLDSTTSTDMLPFIKDEFLINSRLTLMLPDDSEPVKTVALKYTIIISAK